MPLMLATASAESRLTQERGPRPLELKKFLTPPTGGRGVGSMQMSDHIDRPIRRPTVDLPHDHSPSDRTEQRRRFRDVDLGEGSWSGEGARGRG
jgi:hypothetical protein